MIQHDILNVHMNPEQKAKWLKNLINSIEDDKKKAAELEKNRNDSDSRMQSRYDTQKENFALELDIVLDLLARKGELKKEIESAGSCDTAVPGASMVVSINNEEDENFLFMNTPGTFSDIQVITPVSPLGENLVGKKAGETVVYSVKSRSFTAVIKKIE